MNYLSYLLQIQNIFSCYKYSDGFRNTRLNNLEKNVDSEVIKTKSCRKQKTDTKMLPKINEEDTNGIRETKETDQLHVFYLVTQNNI